MTKIDQNHILEGIWPLDLPEGPWTFMTLKVYMEVQSLYLCRVNMAQMVKSGQLRVKSGK